jgi:N-acetylneuraminic acid mutarotase
MWFGVVSLLAGQVSEAQTLSVAATPSGYQLKWSELPSLPDPVGFAGPFVGTAGDALIVAGGANFPDAAPWDGGSKVWHDRLFVLPEPDGKWIESGRLPDALAYGVAVSWRDRMLLIGGGNAKQHSTSVTELFRDGRSVTFRQLPDLPRRCAFMTGVLIGDVVFVVGGIERPDSAEAMKSVWSLDLSVEPGARKWSNRSALKTGRMLAQSASIDGRLFVAGGAGLFRDSDGNVQRRFLKDAWLFDAEEDRWTRAADLPRSIVAAPSPGIACSESAAAFLSGDDGRFFGQDLRFKHPGFPPEVFVYDGRRNRWSQTTPFPRSVPAETGKLRNNGTWPPVTTGVVRWRGRFVIPTGEVRPAVRSPEVYSVTPITLTLQ